MTTELILERVVPISPEDAWRGWTDPETLKLWFCPQPWQTVEAQIDLRPGGAFNTVMQGPNGERVAGSGCYLEVDAPRRLVWTSALGPGYHPQAAGAPGFPFTCILTLEAVEGGTRYTARVLHANTADSEAHAKMGFHEGWAAALGQLVALVQGGMKGHVAES
jgi:uncharacterized protein YndB with AHSA1/START domain